MGVDAESRGLVVVRAAATVDVPALGRLAATLVRMHHAFDAQRFFIVEPIEAGYGRWLGKALQRDDTVVLVACNPDGEVVGYAYGGLQERDWMSLLDACGALHDIYVEPSARRSGAARALVTELASRLRAKGAPRLVLSTAAKNEGAQKFFESMGFRRTMIEMTKEL